MHYAWILASGQITTVFNSYSRLIVCCRGDIANPAAKVHVGRFGKTFNFIRTGYLKGNLCLSDYAGAVVDREFANGNLRKTIHHGIVSLDQHDFQ